MFPVLHLDPILSPWLIQRLTLEKFVERTDKSINFIVQIERDERKPSPETLVDIANALAGTVDSLLTDNIKADNSGISKEIIALINRILRERCSY